MRKILVTTDLSANSKAGIRFAAQLASQADADLVFYHVVEALPPIARSDQKHNAYSGQQIAASESKLKKFVRSALPKTKLPPGEFTYVVEINGRGVVRSVLRKAKQIDAALICFSTRGGGRVKSLFGTVASGLIDYSGVPLMIVPRDYRIRPVTKVFYASDFSALKPELRKVLDFSADLKAKVVVYHYDYLLHVPENRKKLDSMIKKQQYPGVAFKLKKQHIEMPISRHLEADLVSEKASIVIFFTKQNRNWFDRLFGRYESANMAFNAQIPLLVFRKDSR